MAASTTGTTVSPSGHERVACSNCLGACCRLLVIVQEQDDVPDRLTELTATGLRLMARDAQGWCVAIAADHQHCTIYARRPATCRRFTMGGAYCRTLRRDLPDTSRSAPPTFPSR